MAIPLQKHLRPIPDKITTLEDIPVQKVGQHEQGPLALWAHRQAEKEISENNHIHYLPEDKKQLAKQHIKRLLNNTENTYINTNLSKIIQEEQPNYNIQRIPFGEYQADINALAQEWEIDIPEQAKRQKAFTHSTGGFHHNTSSNGYIIERVQNNFAPFLIIAPNIIRERMLESIGPQMYMREEHLTDILEAVQKKHPKIADKFSQEAIQEVTNKNPDKTLGQLILEGSILSHVHTIDTFLGKIPTQKHYASKQLVRDKTMLKMGYADYTPQDTTGTEIYIGFNRKHI